MASNTVSYTHLDVYKRQPVGALLFVAVFLLLVMMQSCMSSLATLGNGTAGAVGASTYPAEDADLLGAELSLIHI